MNDPAEKLIIPSEYLLPFITSSRMSHRKLILKVVTVVMIIRNMIFSSGIVNGACIVVLGLMKNNKPGNSYRVWER